jgi:hypothetical protein
VRFDEEIIDFVVVVENGAGGQTGLVGDVA